MYDQTTMQITDLPPAKNSAARERLLETAARIFYTEGINTAGVDRIVTEADVTLATFYRHFPSKQALILAYLQRVHDDFDTRAAAAQAAAKDPGDVLRLIGHNITAQLLEPGFRGCAFINAALSPASTSSPTAAHRSPSSSRARGSAQRCEGRAYTSRRPSARCSPSSTHTTYASRSTAPAGRPAFRVHGSRPGQAPRPRRRRRP